MGPADFPSANGKRGKTKHYEKIHIKIITTYRVPLYDLLCVRKSENGVMLMSQEGKNKMFY